MQQKVMNVTVNTNDLKTVQCPCGEFVFQSVSIFKVLPSLYSQTGKPSLVTLNCIQCIGCGAVHKLEDVMRSVEFDGEGKIVTTQ